MKNVLTVWLDDSHATLTAQLNEAIRQWQPPTTLGDARGATDSFVIAIARHITAISDELVPEAADNSYRKAYFKAARAMERLVVVARARAYGQGQAARARWSELWPEIRTSLETMFTLERRMASSLDEPTAERVAGGLKVHVTSGPTRSHPYLPHHGRGGRLLRRLFSRADTFWDELQGRASGQSKPASHESEGAEPGAAGDGVAPPLEDRRAKHSGWNWRMKV